MKKRSVRLAAAALLLGAVPSGSAAATPDGCEGYFLGRGACVVLSTAPLDGPVTISISGTAFGLSDARVAVRLEEITTGETLLRCSSVTTGDPVVEISCAATRTLDWTGPFTGTCVVEGEIAGRFFCDLLT